METINEVKKVPQLEDDSERKSKGSEMARTCTVFNLITALCT